jgi:hypothetical protein
VIAGVRTYLTPTPELLGELRGRLDAREARCREDLAALESLVAEHTAVQRKMQKIRELVDAAPKTRSRTDALALIGGEQEQQKTAHDVS